MLDCYRLTGVTPQTSGSWGTIQISDWTTIQSSTYFQSFRYLFWCAQFFQLYLSVCFYRFAQFKFIYNSNLSGQLLWKKYFTHKHEMIILLAIWCQQSPTRHKSKIAILAFSFGNYPENSFRLDLELIIYLVSDSCEYYTGITNKRCVVSKS